MATRMPIHPGEFVPTADQRVVTHGVPWSSFEAQLALRGDAPVPRMAYLEGALEFMSPSKDHERIKSTLALMVAAYALERGIEFTPYGSWTITNAPRQSGAEPDECYIAGTDQSKDTPDLAIDVVWTSGGIDKLEIYRRLGVGEVWFWTRGRIEVHVYHQGRFAPAVRSQVFPDLDLNLVCSLLDRPTASQAVRDLLERLRQP